MSLREQIKAPVTTIAGNIKAATSVSTKITEVISSGKDNKFVTLYTTIINAE